MTRDSSSTQATTIVNELAGKLRDTAEEIVPWFLNKMPRRYFQDTDAATRLQHLTAILAMRASGMPLKLTLKNTQENEWTFIQDRDYPGLLAELLDQLPGDRVLAGAKVHTSADLDLVLDVFSFAADDPAADVFDPNNARQAKKRDQVMAYAEKSGIDPAPAGSLPLTEFIACSGFRYVATVTPFRLVDTWQHLRDLFGTNDTRVIFQREEDSPNTWRISVATGNAPKSAMLKRIAQYLGSVKFDILRAYFDRYEAGPGKEILLASFVGEPTGANIMEGEELVSVRRDLTRIKWINSRALALNYSEPDIGLLRAEVVIALGQLVHPALAQENRHAFSRDRILSICEREVAVSKDIAGLFLATFDPKQPLSETARDERIKSMLVRIEREVDDPDSRRVLAQLLLAVQATLYTNAFVEGRYALAFRIDPQRLGMPQSADAPYGVFFVTGRGFSGFHVRFRDIARGGMRVVLTRNMAQHTLEAERLYREVYDLAFAQQLKNKDIPEGGAKAVVLSQPDIPLNRSFKAFVNSLIDLMSPDEAVRAQIANPSGLLERLYLGPDENISPELIEWVANRAKERGFPSPNALMSSKPDAGINHKEYGVTSEGVTVFLEEALLEIGIDPRKEPFTVKIAGGPDGDVAGNEMRILDREFGENARIVGIADGSGCAEDPDGLNHAELIRLFEAGQAIEHFDRKKLGPRGSLVSVAEKDGIKLRNTMHNRVVADAFVPAGGRPSTINEENWREYLHDGKPSSRVIVEGANLFITPGARKYLSQEAGVLIVKDSSANKCGVICSSYEIMASMLLSPEEFRELKAPFVAEVLDRLRKLARREARLLFREHIHNPELPLPELSIRLSRVILHATDAIEAALPDVIESDRQLLDALIADHVPPVLLDRAGDKLPSNTPPAYVSGMIAATLATKIVYREGLEFLANLDSDALSKLALRYLRQEQETKKLVAEVSASGLANRDRIADIIEMAGSRAGLLLR
ncbi:MAG: NAD-glutamate dehydrogenase [Proteobacteria bacterium]|nr:NAD-glutamate dehydrogenase [Pseudomonadota bacterium]